MTAAQKTLAGALVGLARSLDASNSTADMLAVILSALRAFEQDDLASQIQAVREAKLRAVPDCAVCHNPCGRTFDYDFAEADALDPSLVAAKYRLVDRIVRYARSVPPDGDFSPPLEALKDALFAVGYDWFTPEQLDSKLA